MCENQPQYISSVSHDYGSQLDVMMFILLMLEIMWIFYGLMQVLEHYIVSI